MLRPYKRRLKRWLLTKHLRSQVREPAALPQKSCPKHETAPLLQCHFHQPSHSVRVRHSRKPRAHGTHRLSCKNRSRSRELRPQQQPVRGNGRHDRDDDEGGTSHVLPKIYLKSSNANNASHANLRTPMPTKPQPHSLPPPSQGITRLAGAIK